MTKRFTPYQLRDLGDRASTILERERARLRDGDGSAAAQREAVTRIIDDYGRRGVHHVVRLWLDSLFEVTPGTARVEGSHIDMIYTNPDHNEILHEADASQIERVSAELFRARIRGDHVLVYDMLSQIPTNPTGASVIAGIAEVFAFQINSLEVVGVIPTGVVRVFAQADTDD